MRIIQISIGANADAMSTYGLAGGDTTEIRRYDNTGKANTQWRSDIDADKDIIPRLKSGMTIGSIARELKCCDSTIDRRLNVWRKQRGAMVDFS